jgi:hypothetical protein
MRDEKLEPRRRKTFCQHVRQVSLIFVGLSVLRPTIETFIGRSPGTKVVVENCGTFYVFLVLILRRNSGTFYVFLVLILRRNSTAETGLRCVLPRWDSNIMTF